MNGERDHPQRDLRDRAEAILATLRQEGSTDLSQVEIRRLIHDLSVHQIELELQNEELRNAQVQLEYARDRYTRLYHQAPEGYLSLDASGVIRQFNQTFADLMGDKQIDLVGKPLADLMSGADRDIFLSRFKAFFKNPEGKSMDVTLHRRKAGSFIAHLTGRRETDAVSSSGRPAAALLLVIVSDVTDQKAMEDALRQERDASQRYLGVVGSIVMVIRQDQTVSLINQAGCQLLGYRQEEIIGANWFDRFLPERLRTNAKAHFNRLISETLDLIKSLESVVLTHSGEERIVVWRNTVLRNMAGNIVGTLSSGEDVTERRQAEAALREREAILHNITAAAQDAIVMMDPAGLISFWNPAAEQIFGYTPQEALGQNLHQLLAPERYHDAHYKAFPAFLNSGRGNAIGKTLGLHALRKDGVEIAVAVSLSAFQIENQWYAVGILRDETERKAQELELRRLATTDPLTGLANRRHFLSQVERELDRFKRHAQPAALLMLDLDHFKQVNDTYGHALGDAVLKHFAVISSQVLRKIDLLGRLGGEEFAVLLPDTTLIGAYPLAERLRGIIMESPAGSISFTVSIGVALFAPSDQDANAILIRADRALYRAKNRGRNRVEMEKPEDNERTSRRRVLTAQSQ
jgi:diguanylate cyclase (GGDEF)-like protein/PAS domain S-box-containing protein